MTTTTLPSVAERVAAGAAYLDQHQPGWDAQIDLDRLNISSACDCVLGQLYGQYLRAPLFDNAESGSDCVDRAAPLGFAFHYPDERRSRAALTAAWHELIETRRAVTPDA